jgi:hypothetical protein
MTYDLQATLLDHDYGLMFCVPRCSDIVDETSHVFCSSMVKCEFA